MSNLLDENLVPFAAGIRSLPGRPSVSTGYRFALRGIKGIRLESIVVGGRRFTSREALRRFVAGTTQAAEPRSCQPSPTADLPVTDETERLDRELDKKGL